MAGSAKKAIAPEKGNRIEWIDSLRFLAIFWVMIFHFISNFNNAIFFYWRNTWTSFFLFGITGKLSVSFFAVLLGYFATRKFASPTSFARYTVNRYLDFSVGILLAELAFIFAGILSIHLFGNTHAFERVQFDAQSPPLPALGIFRLMVMDSFAFESKLIVTFWCMKDFFIGSLLTAILSRFIASNAQMRTWHKIVVYFLVFLILLVLGKTFINLIVIGGLFCFMQSLKLKLLDNKVFCLAVLLSIPLLIRRDVENAFAYYCQGFASVALLIFCFRFRRIQRILSVKWLTKPSEISFQLFLIHTPINRAIIWPLYDAACVQLGWKAAFFVCLAVYVVITLCAAWTLKRLSNTIIQKLQRAFNPSAHLSVHPPAEPLR